PAYHVDLASADGDLVVAAGLDAEQNLLLIRRDQGAPRPGRALELWLIADGAEAPVSLGVLPDENEIFVTLPAELVQQFAGATLAISDEPEGGSPTGAPTGAVLAAAAVETL
ncbi:MAG: anti-sigma factor, partial [Pseudomonadota bacterium]|nr:anti-sigma factor [Pseudomonadota bacterium]